MADRLERTIASGRVLETETQRLTWAREDLLDGRPPELTPDQYRRETQAELRHTAEQLDDLEHPLATDIRAIANALEPGQSPVDIPVPETIAALDRVGVALAADLARMEDLLGVDLRAAWPLRRQDDGLVLNEEWGAEFVMPLSLAELRAIAISDPGGASSAPTATSRDMTEDEQLREAEEVLGPAWSEVLRGGTRRDEQRPRAAAGDERDSPAARAARMAHTGQVPMRGSAPQTEASTPQRPAAREMPVPQRPNKSEVDR